MTAPIRGSIVHYTVTDEEPSRTGLGVVTDTTHQFVAVIPFGSERTNYFHASEVKLLG